MRTGRRQSRRSRDGWQQGHPSQETTCPSSRTVTTLVKTKKVHLLVLAQDIDPTEQLIFLLVLCLKMAVLHCIIKRKARLGWLLPKKTSVTAAFTQVNSEDKGSLAKWMEALWTSNNDRYQEICCHLGWGGNVLSSKSVAQIAKQE